MGPQDHLRQSEGMGGLLGSASLGQNRPEAILAVRQPMVMNWSKNLVVSYSGIEEPERWLDG